MSPLSCVPLNLPLDPAQPQACPSRRHPTRGATGLHGRLAVLALCGLTCTAKASPSIAPGSPIASVQPTAQVGHHSEASRSHTRVPAPLQWGRVSSVKQEEVQDKPKGVGLVAGALVGGLIGHSFGHGFGNALTTVGGAAAGGYAGNSIERHARHHTVYLTSITLDNGHGVSLPLPKPLPPGARVTVQGKHVALASAQVKKELPNTPSHARASLASPAAAAPEAASKGTSPA